MSISHRIYKEKVERGFNAYRQQLENWQLHIETTERGAGEAVSLDGYGCPGRFFTSRAGFAELRLSGRGTTHRVITGPKRSGWFIYIPAMGVLCSVTDPEDFLGNRFRLNKAMGSLDARSIAEGVCTYAKEARRKC